MSENCNHACESCGEDCAERQAPQGNGAPPRLAPNELSSVRHVVAVMSGKGGVGKSIVTALSAVAMANAGFAAGIMDADITGPSIPKMFGVAGDVRGDASGAYPLKSDGGIDIISMNLLLPDQTVPVIWRGPVISGVVRQFWQEVIWQDIDYLFVDMPPGTGDVPLTVFQSLPVDAIIVVTSPQDLVTMIVEKAVKMAQMMNIPLLGIVENMAYFRCPDCGKAHEIFGSSRLPEIAARYSLPVLGRLPLDAAFSKAADSGEIETLDSHYFDELVASLKKLDE